MKHVHIIVSQTAPHPFTATIEEIPEIQISAPTLEETRMHMFDMVHLFFMKNSLKEDFKLNIVVKMKLNMASL